MPSPADPVAAFAGHLEDASDSTAAALAAALDEVGFTADAVLLRAYVERGPHWHRTETWSGSAQFGSAQFGSRRGCWVGPTPPLDSRAGDLWFDPGEVIGAVLAPRPEFEELDPYWQGRLTPFTAWMSVRPVADWQLEGSLRLATTAGARPRRNGALAAAYAAFFGKSLATAEDWSAIMTAFGAEPVLQLWGGDHAAELGGYLQEGLMAGIALDRILDRTVDGADDDDAVDEGEPLTSPFRTHVPTQLGLLPSDRSWARTR